MGAKIIGMDYLFQVSIASWLKTLDLPPNHRSLNYDGPFKDQLASGQVVLAGNLAVDEHQKSTIILPIKEYSARFTPAEAGRGVDQFLQ